MLKGIKRRIASIRTIRTLCETAERLALDDQQHEAGAEHFLLAALELPDNSARRAFEAVGADPAAFRSAVHRQYESALAGMGMAFPGPEALPRRKGIYNASASGRVVMNNLAVHRKAHNPLLAAHVVEAVATMEQGVAARALQDMGLDRNALAAAARDVASSHPK